MAELVLFDDASTDGTALLQQLYEQHGRQYVTVLPAPANADGLTRQLLSSQACLDMYKERSDWVSSPGSKFLAHSSTCGVQLRGSHRLQGPLYTGKAPMALAPNASHAVHIFLATCNFAHIEWSSIWLTCVRPSQHSCPHLRWQCDRPSSSANGSCT